MILTKNKNKNHELDPIIEYVFGSLLFELETKLRYSGIQNNKLYGAWYNWLTTNLELKCISK